MLCPVWGHLHPWLARFILYTIATQMVINAASVNIWPQIALDIVLPVNIYMSDSIASEQYFEELLQSCACHYMSNATKEAHLHVKTS